MVQISGTTVERDGNSKTRDLGSIKLSTPVAAAGQLEQIKTYFLQTIPMTIHEPIGMFKHRFMTPTYGVVPGADDNLLFSERVRVGYYHEMYDWDSCLATGAQCYLGLKDLAHDVVSNFLALIGADGHIPRVVSPYRVWEGSDLAKPFMCQALLKEQNTNCSTRPVDAEMIEGLEQYLSYFDKHRRHVSGLYHWNNVLESGVDNNLALLFPVAADQDDNTQLVHGYPDGELIAVDLCTYLAADYLALSELAGRAGATNTAKRCAERSNQIISQIEDTLWNEVLGSYFNYDSKSGHYAAIHSWTNLTPVLFGFARPERAKQVIENLILNPEHFLRPAGLAAMSASEGHYGQVKRGLYGRANVSNWQGPVWGPPNFFAIRGLLKYGYKEQAEELALRFLATVAASIESAGTTYENWDAETGKPVFAPQFISWNALCLELLEVIS